jgi:hypothetical protein
MAIEWKIEENNLVVFEVHDKLVKEEHQNILTEIENLINKLGHIKILVLLRNFSGWEVAEGWEEPPSENIDRYIKKFAIVGDEKWKDLAEVFTLKGLRPFPIEYFVSATDKEARDWLLGD